MSPPVPTPLVKAAAHLESCQAELLAASRWFLSICKHVHLEQGESQRSSEGRLLPAGCRGRSCPKQPGFAVPCQPRNLSASILQASHTRLHCMAPRVKSPQQPLPGFALFCPKARKRVQEKIATGMILSYSQLRIALGRQNLLCFFALSTISLAEFLVQVTDVCSRSEVTRFSSPE